MRLSQIIVEYIFSTIIGILIIAVSSGFAQKTTKAQSQGDRLRSLPPSATILFLSNRDIAPTEKGRYRKEIYSMDAQGGDITRLTYTDDHHYLFGIDPSGRYLVVSRADKDTAQPAGLGDEDLRNVWILDLGTKEETRLTAPENLAEGDSFSPDGNWVVFFMAPKGKEIADIYKIKKDGTGLINLTNTPFETEADPVWSNNGDRIAFISLDGKTKRFVLKVMNQDGSNMRPVYDAKESVSTPYFPPGAYDPSWSPDDRWIAFSKPIKNTGENGTAGVWHICKIRPDGTGFVDLSEAGGHAGWAEYVPRFSHDGKSIIFNTRYGPKNPAMVKLDIFVMANDGTSLKKLTSSPAVEDGAFWIK